MLYERLCQRELRENRMKALVVFFVETGPQESLGEVFVDFATSVNTNKIDLF